MQQHVRRSLLVIGLALLGIGVSVAIDHIHARLTADHAYTSFCNVNATVNCDVVLTSRYATLLGVAISRWAILYYAIVITIAAVVGWTPRASTRETFARLTLVLQIWGVLFSGYLGVVALVILRTVCLLCSSLYLINIGLFAAAWWLYSGLRVMGRRQRAAHQKSDRLVLVGSLGAVLLLVAVGGWETFGGAGQQSLSTAEDIARVHPEFYQWFFKQPLVSVPTDGDHSLGGANAPVTVVEFSDFECGHCYNFHRSLDQVLRTGGSHVRVVFRHFPLDPSCNPGVRTRIHEDACLAATAAECAAEQSRFWEYHNLLFAHQQELGREFLIAYADQVGLDRDRFAACLGGRDARARVERDAGAATQLGIDSTPTVFINGRMIKGALDPEQLAEALVLARSSKP
jgi:protein-disulfide isomerase/uncharacterized membrane protein